MELLTTNGLDTVESIENALEQAEGNVQRGLLTMLLASKKRELELANKLAKKTTAKSAFSEEEAVIKSLFVALRPHVNPANPECIAVKTFKAAVIGLNDIFTVELQERIFSTSTWHCAKSNIIKATNKDAALDSFKEAVKQAKLLFVSVPEATWLYWTTEMANAYRRANVRVQANPVQPETVQANPVQPETVQANPVQPDKKTVITRKNKK